MTEQQDDAKRYKVVAINLLYPQQDFFLNIRFKPDFGVSFSGVILQVFWLIPMNGSLPSFVGEIV